MLAVLVAVGALIFNGLSTVGQLQGTQHQLQIAEQGQITDRYNAAIANLGATSIDIRLGGIYALQRLMRDSPRDQPTVIAVLCAFAREPTASSPSPQESSAPSLPTDVQAALSVVGTRNTANDGRTTLIDLSHATLADAQLEFLRLTGADLSGAYLAGANLIYTHLAGANLSGANLATAHLTNTDLARADLSHVNLTGAVLAGANLAGASFFGANLTGAVLAGENLPYLSFATATLTGADISGANVTNGYLIASDLAGANLTGADMRQANLSHANLSYADLSGADLTSANLKGANWPHGAIVPGGWQRNPSSGRLERAGR